MVDKLGMKPKKTTGQIEIESLANRLRKHPEMLTHIESLLDMAESEELGSLENLELRLEKEVRHLGGKALEESLKREEARIAEAFRKEVPGVQQREKKR